MCLSERNLPTYTSMCISFHTSVHLTCFLTYYIHLLCPRKKKNKNKINNSSRAQERCKKKKVKKNPQAGIPPSHVSSRSPRRGEKSPAQFIFFIVSSWPTLLIIVLSHDPSTPLHVVEGVHEESKQTRILPYRSR